MPSLCTPYGLSFHLKRSFKSILEKKHQKFPLRDRSYGMRRIENCNQSFRSWTISLDGMGLSLNLLLAYLTFRSNSGGVPLDENF